MKTCEHCFSGNEDSAAVCARCGSQSFKEDLKEDLNLPSGGETEIFGSIAKGSARRWRVEIVGADLANLTASPPNLPLEMAGPFKIQTPNASGKGAATVFDTDKKGGSGTLRIDGDTVTLEHKKRVGIIGWTLFGVTGMILLAAVMGAGRSALPVVIILGLGLVGGLMAWLSRRQRWFFLLGRIVNVRVIRLTLRGGQPGVQFTVLPSVQPEGAPVTASAQDCCYVTFATETAAAASALVCHMPKRTAFVGDSETQQRARFAQQLVAATPRIWANAVLVGLNTLVYVLMLAALVTNPAFVRNSLAPTPAQATDWGANFGPLTLSGDWWRLLTCCFVHFGFLHFALNMWALWWVGKITERLLGNWMYLAIYLGCGVVASLNSLCWHPMVVSAGASGAIFGVFGAVLGYLARRRRGVPEGVMAPLTKSLVVFLLAQLSGVSETGVDFAAHFGGLVSGLIFGFMAARPLELAERRAATGKSILLLGGSMAVVAAVWVSQLPSLGKVMAQGMRQTPEGGAPAAPAQAMSRDSAQAAAEAVRIQREFSRSGKAQLIDQAFADIRSNQVTRINQIASAIVDCDTALALGIADNRQAFDSAASRIYADCAAIRTNCSAICDPAGSWRRQAGNPMPDAKTADQMMKVLAVDFPHNEMSVKIAESTAAYIRATTNLIGFLDAQWGKWRMGADGKPEFEQPAQVASFQAEQEQFQKANDHAQTLLLSPKSIASLRRLKTMTATNAATARAFAAGLSLARTATPEDLERIHQAMRGAVKKVRVLGKKSDAAVADCAKSFSFTGVKTLDQYQVKKKLADDACAILGELAAATSDPARWYCNQLVAGGVDAAVADHFIAEAMPSALESEKDRSQAKQLSQALAIYVQNVTNQHAFLLANWGQWQATRSGAAQFSDPALDAAYRNNLAGLTAARNSLTAPAQSPDESQSGVKEANTREPARPPGAPDESPDAWPVELQFSGIFFNKANPQALINGKMHGPGEAIQGVVLKRIEPDKVTVEWNGRTKVLMMGTQ